MEGWATTPHYRITTDTRASGGQSSFWTPKTHLGPPKPTRGSHKAKGRRERLSWLTAIPFYLRRPDSITLTNYLASEVFSKLLPGTPC